MTLTEARPHDAAASFDRSTGQAPPRGFRPASRRRARIAAGALLAAAAIGGNVVLYSSLDERSEFLQLARDVRAGDVVTADDLRVVEADLDATVRAVRADDVGTIVGRHARTYLASGSLLTDGLVQSEPLVAEGAAVVAVEVSPGRVPAGLTTRSDVLLVVPIAGDEPFVTTARVVERPTDGDRPAMSFEVAREVAPRIAAADGIRVVLVEPGVDPAVERGADR